MKRSEINHAFLEANRCFLGNGWALPPNARWDITDFGLGRFPEAGLTLINLAEEPEYCEKLMFAWRGQRTPCHTHARKKEDIICRAGILEVWLWAQKPGTETEPADRNVRVAIDGEMRTVAAAVPVRLVAGSRITITPRIWHAFAPVSESCVIGEVSTANDDVNDNFFLDPEIGRFPGIEEDEPPLVRLISE